jgi:hypothetical protein
VVAIVVYGIGFFMISHRPERLGALGKAIGMVGGPPTPEQAAGIAYLGRRDDQDWRVDAILL